MANAVESAAVWGRVLLIGGGPRCQFYYGEIVQRLLGAMGIGILPEDAFASKPFGTDWMDTTESQRLLRYQQRDLDDYA
ncbi:MAG: NAD(P)-dependent oxidoreductase, partial [Anaerolineae bacterium]|nr:NAD(P)-dependent oxidoreductase [Anaerolineae bacterium]